MKVKICPLCDSEMKKAHYCDTCKSFIWRPELLDIHYNAEARGKGEEDCAYGSVHDTYDHEDAASGKAARSRERKETSRRQERRSERTYTGDKKKTKGRLSKIIAIILILNIIGSAVGGLFEIIEDRLDSFEFAQRIPESIAEEEVTAEVDYEDSYREIAGDELADYPDGCNGYAHFDMTQDELLRNLFAWSEIQAGVAPESAWHSEGDNYKFVYEKDEEWVYLQKSCSFYHPSDEYSFVQINYDSVTERVHSVEAYLSQRSDAESLMVLLIKLLDEYAGRADQAPLEQESTTFFNNVSGDYYSMIYDDIRIYASESEDGYIWMEVSPAE